MAGDLRRFELFPERARLGWIEDAAQSIGQGYDGPQRIEASCDPPGKSGGGPLRRLS